MPIHKRRQTPVRCLHHEKQIRRDSIAQTQPNQRIHRTCRKASPVRQVRHTRPQRRAKTSLKNPRLED